MLDCKPTAFTGAEVTYESGFESSTWIAVVLDLLERLGPKAQAGSKPRCHWLAHGDRVNIAERLGTLAAPFATVSPEDRWMPQGFNQLEECQLHRPSPVLSTSLCHDLGAWWLAAASARAKTPNIDIASTCTVHGEPGLLLVEAKAHLGELEHEEGGRRQTRSSAHAEHFDDEAEARGRDLSQRNREASRETIGNAIAEASNGLSIATGRPFRLAQDHRYQMCNRFAWSWKLAAEGIPVVLMYLGFLHVRDRPTWRPINSQDEWEAAVRAHSAILFPSEVWDREWNISGRSFAPLIRTIDIPLRPAMDSI